LGLLITADEQQRPANEAKMGKWRAFASTPKSKGMRMLFFILASLAGLCCLSVVINNPKSYRSGCTEILLEIHQTLFLHPQNKKKKAVWAQDQKVNKLVYKKKEFSTRVRMLVD